MINCIFIRTFNYTVDGVLYTILDEYINVTNGNIILNPVGQFFIFANSTLGSLI